MNTTQTSRPSNDRNRPATFVSETPATSSLHAPRARDFGVGYGSSSGYASTRRYAGAASGSRFRFA